MMCLIVWIIQPHPSVYLQRVNPITKKKKPFSNVMREIIHNHVVDKNYEDFEHIISANNIDRKSITTTLVYEFLKDKGIKNYRKTFALMNKTSHNEVVLSNNGTITKVSILFEDFIKYLHKYKQIKAISYGFFLNKIFEVLNITCNLRPNYTKTSKRDEKSEMWNKFIINLLTDHLKIREHLYLYQITMNITNHLIP
jgi:hypothetical protein